MDPAFRPAGSLKNRPALVSRTLGSVCVRCTGTTATCSTSAPCLAVAYAWNSPSPTTRPETMQKIRVLIVDDEKPARTRLRQCLEEAPDVEIVGTARDGKEGLRLIRGLTPDLVFLDVRM